MKRPSKFFPLAAGLLFASVLLAQSSIPEIPFDSAPNLLKFPDNIYFGEVVGVSTNSKGHIFVYSRSGSVDVSTGTSRPFTRGGSRLFEFNPNGSFVREIGQGLYGFVYAHTVRVDPQDNIWVVDQGSNMVIKFNPEGRVLMTFGRRPETVPVPAAALLAQPAQLALGDKAFEGRGVGAGVLGDNFNEPTDVVWDAAGNVFIADGHGNSRIAKFDKDGRFIKTWGHRGKDPGQFNDPHSLAFDAKGNLYVADRENHRIQIFDGDGNFKSEISNVGARPNAICVSPGPHQYLYVSNTNTEDMKNGEIFKLELDGTIVGKFGKAGRQLKEFNGVAALDCRGENEMYVAENMNWRIQKLTLHPVK